MRILVSLVLFFSAWLLPSAPAASADSGVCAVPGQDGPGGTLSGIVNTYYPGTSSAAAGDTSIPVGAPSGSPTAISVGDLLLVVQMQDAAINSTNSGAYGDGVAGDPATGSTGLNNSGRYEYVVATGPVSVGSVPILGSGSGSGLVFVYTNADATGTQGQRRFQVIRVPQYTTASLSSGLTALRWNGTVGGILALDVSGTLTLGGTVDLNGFGFRGGGGRQLQGDVGLLDTDYRTLSSLDVNGSKGEGIAGTPQFFYNSVTTTVVDSGVEGYPNGSMARGAPGNAGGGGTDGDTLDNDRNSGGGGGGNGANGGSGGNTWTSNLPRGGFGGATFPAIPAQLVLGGGGGAGTRNDTPTDPPASSGGAGGGMAFIRTGFVAGTGTITLDGDPGLGAENDGSGGGGSGGTLLFLAESSGLGGLTASAQGGAGGDSWPTQAPGPFFPGARHGPGGGGGGGVVLLSSAVAGTDVGGGANGTTTTAADPYGATSGADGIVRTNVTASELPTGIGGAACLAPSGGGPSAATTLPETGFAPHRVSRVPQSPSLRPYTDMGNLQLEIPEFGVLSEIVGVSADWDVTWLGNSVGYLPGTAFPTWSGNTAIAGHVYLKDGMPGPFNRIGELMWGDEINIQAYGFRHKYEVREVATVQPTDLSVLGHEEYDWLTLITCRGYDEDSDTYRWRVVVRAVLMEVEPISDA